MPYGDHERIRMLAGNPDTTNVSPTILAQAAEVGDSMVHTFTGVSSFSETEEVYPLVQEAAEAFAAWRIRRRFPDPEGKAKALYEDAQEMCIIIRKSGAGIFIASPSYRTYPLNESATPYKSLSGANNSTDDSDLS